MGLQRPVVRARHQGLGGHGHARLPARAGRGAERGPHPPDAFLVELAPPIPADLAFPHFQALVDSGIPLWVAYRRAVDGPVGIFGEDQAPDGDLFGRAAQTPGGAGRRRAAGPLPAAGEGARRGPLAARVHHLPLGVYPNNGRYDKWKSGVGARPSRAEQMAEHARGYAAEGMNIIGGCCGTRPEHIAAMAEALK